jgi:hypothetical protein
MEAMAPDTTDNDDAIKFYKEWIENGVWTLEEAAWLYAGYDPISKKFYGSFERPKPGRYIEPPDRFVRENQGGELVDESGDPIDSFSEDFDRQTILKDFVQNHVDAGNLIATGDKNGVLKFKPQNIVAFFQIYFANVPSQALINALPLAGKKNLTSEERIKKKRGRKMNTGVILGDDERVVNMKNLIDQKKAKSVYDAASQTVRSLGQSGASEEADIRRITRKYNKKHSV